MCRTELLPSAVDAVRVFTAKRVVGGVPVLMPAQQRYVVGWLVLVLNGKIWRCAFCLIPPFGARF